MQQHLEQGDLMELSELAHRLISASSFVGAWPLVQQAKELEVLCKTADAVREVFTDFLCNSRLAEQAFEVCWQQIEAAHSASQALDFKGNP